MKSTSAQYLTPKLPSQLLRYSKLIAGSGYYRALVTCIRSQVSFARLSGLLAIYKSFVSNCPPPQLSSSITTSWQVMLINISKQDAAQVMQGQTRHESVSELAAVTPPRGII